MSAAEGQHVARMTITTLKSIRNDESYESFWESVTLKAKLLDIGEPKLPRNRKVPKRYDSGKHVGDFHDTPETFYKQMYFEGLDLIINCIESRFDQPGFRSYRSIESLLLKASKKEDLSAELDELCKTYKDDFDREVLYTQLQILGSNFNGDCKRKDITIFDVRNYLVSLSASQLSLISQVKRLMQLLLVMPATNASSERSFSALRRVKSYLRSSMTQKRLNHLMLLHVHKEHTDELNMKSVVNDFIDASEHRAKIFQKY